MDWIATSDRKPNKGEQVLVWVSAEHGDSFRLARWWPEVKSRCFDEQWDIEPGYSNDPRYFVPLFWAPIPKPPLSVRRSAKRSAELYKRHASASAYGLDRGSVDCSF